MAEKLSLSILQEQISGIWVQKVKIIYFRESFSANNLNLNRDRFSSSYEWNWFKKHLVKKTMITF